MTIVFLPLIIVACLLGSVSTAYLVARLFRGIDIRQCDSDSTRISNIWHSTFKWTTIPVIPLDLGRGTLMVFIAQQRELDISEFHK
ncbi:glycerol-3-phosphate acyltransferase [Chloroflexota bacterium]